jgi:hypothetical protein
MNRPGRAAGAAAMVCGFSFLVLFAAFLADRRYPVTVIAGETSPGTWLSGALLVTAAVLSLIAGMRRGWLPWSAYSLFFSVLSLDERFMFHEAIKRRILFAFPGLPPGLHWICEAPVLLGAAAGAGIAFHLWRRAERRTRVFLGAAVLLGAVSAAMDVLRLGVFFEDACKILGELSLVCGLLGEIDA